MELRKTLFLMIYYVFQAERYIQCINYFYITLKARALKKLGLYIFNGLDRMLERF